MKKLLFFTEPWWAFGAISYGLSRILYQHGIICNVIDWRHSYSPVEKEFLKSSYDIFVTTPVGGVMLHQSWNIDLRKIFCVSHANWDIKIALHLTPDEFYNNLLGYSVVCDHLVAESINAKIARVPEVTKIGIHFDQFYRPVPDRLMTVGYAGATDAKNFEQQEIKRYGSFLNSVESAGLSQKTCESYHFASMPGFYESVDAIMVTSTEEGAGLPSMEGAAAGRLILSTPVGYFSQNHHIGAGVCLPMNKDELEIRAVEKLTFYKENSKEFIENCERCQSFARDHYDWSKVINAWLAIILK